MKMKMKMKMRMKMKTGGDPSCFQTRDSRRR